MEARTGLSDHCGLTAERQLEEILVWLMDLLYDSGDGNIAVDELEVCNESFVFNQLFNPHCQVEQGFITSGWRTAKVSIDKCQCTLEQATSEIDLLAKPNSISQPMEQDIPKEVPKGSLWGLQEWNKGEVCAEMCMPPSSDTPSTHDLEETLCQAVV